MVGWGLPLLLAAASGASALAPLPPDGIGVVSAIPGRSPSRHYAVEVRDAAAASSAPWQQSFVLETAQKPCGGADCSAANHGGYFKHLDGFSSSWTNVMLPQGRGTAGVRLRLSRIGGAAVSAAKIHPARANATVTSISGNGVELLITGPAQFTVTLDGGLDDVDTGPSYKGPPIHTFSAFINPYLAAPSGAGVVTVAAGAPIPALPAGTKTLLFGPGEHRLPTALPAWPVYSLPSGVTVHVPPSAILYFALLSNTSHADIKLEGHGSVSGEEMTRCHEGAADTSKDCTNNSPQGLTLKNVAHAEILGVTFVDFPNHHIIAAASERPDGWSKPCAASSASRMTNIKVMGWRANGDVRVRFPRAPLLRSFSL